MTRQYESIKGAWSLAAEAGREIQKYFPEIAELKRTDHAYDKTLAEYIQHRMTANGTGSTSLLARLSSDNIWEQAVRLALIGNDRRVNKSPRYPGLMPKEEYEEIARANKTAVVMAQNEKIGATIWNPEMIKTLMQATKENRTINNKKDCIDWKKVCAIMEMDKKTAENAY